MAILVLADHDNHALSALTARVLRAAGEIGGDIDVLVAGHECAAVADETAALEGVRRVLLADHPVYAHHLAEPLTDLMVGRAPDYDTLLAAASAAGKNVMPRVAACLDVMQISDIVAVDGAAAFRRPIYAGNAIAHVTSRDATRVVTVRTTAFQPVGPGGAAPVEVIDIDPAPGPAEWLEDVGVESDRPDLATARRVVSGGRALGSKDGFDQLILPLADALGAAVGASRDAVDEGFAPNDWQVGQTGKTVAPQLYVACGISGAIQHLAGIKDAGTIVAINADPDAPIFKVADYGLVGDLFEIVPELTERLAKS